MKLNGEKFESVLFEAQYEMPKHSGNFVNVMFVTEWDREMTFGIFNEFTNTITIAIEGGMKNREVLRTITHEVAHAFDFEIFGSNAFAKTCEKVAVMLANYGREIIDISDLINNDFAAHSNVCEPLSDKPF